MAAKVYQYFIGKEDLYFFYRFVILRWELEWIDKKYLMSKGVLNKYCQDQNISIKSFESADKLHAAISSDYEAEESKVKGILWFVRKDTKPKDTLRHLRNCLAHSNFQKRKKHRVQCLVMENIDKGRVKAKGFLPIEMLKGLVSAACSCEI